MGAAVLEQLRARIGPDRVFDLSLEMKSPGSLASQVREWSLGVAPGQGGFGFATRGSASSRIICDCAAGVLDVAGNGAPALALPKKLPLRPRSLRTRATPCWWSAATGRCSSSRGSVVRHLLLPLTSYLLPLTSDLLPLTSDLLPLTSYL